MKIKEIKSLKIEQIKGKIVELKKEHFNLRFQKSSGQLTNTARIRQVKATIARLITVLNENSSKAGGENA
ncbi:MAG: 50S ribosomal protein L29 [Rickettsiales bacterium]